MHRRCHRHGTASTNNLRPAHNFLLDTVLRSVQSVAMELSEILKRAGGASELARALGVTPSTPIRWNGAVPAHHVPAVSRLTGIPRHELNALWAEPEKSEAKE